LKPGSTCDPYDLAELLVDAGFTRADPVDAHGEFCVRGGVVDVFPAGHAQPVRLDFVGDTVESVRSFDAATQRSTGELDRVLIIPLKDVFERESGAGSRAPGEGEPAAFSTSRSASDRAVGQALRRGPLVLDGDGDEDSAAAGKDEDDLAWAWEDDEDGRHKAEDREDRFEAPPSADPDEHPASRLSLLSPTADRSSSLFDYVSRPTLYLCEGADVRARAAKSLEQLTSSHDDAAARGAAVPAPAAVFTSLDDLDVLFDAATSLDELEIDPAAAPGDGVQSFACQPTVEFTRAR
jgi:transcription-repair coupling factor (superfamily II helicase)